MAHDSEHSHNGSDGSGTVSYSDLTNKPDYGLLWHPAKGYASNTTPSDWATLFDDPLQSNIVCLGSDRLQVTANPGFGPTFFYSRRGYSQERYGTLILIAYLSYEYGHDGQWKMGLDQTGAHGLIGDSNGLTADLTLGSTSIYNFDFDITGAGFHLIELKLEMLSPSSRKLTVYLDGVEKGTVTDGTITADTAFFTYYDIESYMSLVNMYIRKIQLKTDEMIIP